MTFLLAVLLVAPSALDAQQRARRPATSQSYANPFSLEP
jgi:hypothetical protein